MVCVRGDGSRSARQYDAMAVEYSTDNDESAFNAYYERPAMIGLLGDVSGYRVLEVGCGAGPLTAWLVDHGATVTATDVSPGMLERAKQRVGLRATFHLADLARPLSFAADGEFDLVVASLVLHYLEDWASVLGEVRRVLKQDGAVVFSTHHPAMDWQLHSPEDYFAVKQVTEVWSKGSGDFEVTFWRRPLTAMTEAIASAGFVIDRLIEPGPLPELRDRDLDNFEKLRHEPQFLFFRLTPR
jgi:ubiquinone/menaquinone biosynthesis C-methylase UbiE